MSREDVDRLRAAIDALQADTSEDDWEATLAGAWVELWDPEIEWDASTHPMPDLAGVYRGIEPTLGWWREWLAAWEAVRVEYKLIEAGDRVVGVFHQHMRGLYTGIDVASGRYAMVFTFRNGLIVRAKFYARPSEALEAVRLPSQPLRVGSRLPDDMTHQPVCISHATGADGAAVGRAVAERLGFRYIDEEVIAEAAEWAELDPAIVADAERRKPLVARLLGHMTEGGPAQRLSSGEWARTAPTDADLRAVITDVLRSFADKGSVVIVSHAASFALPGGEVLRVLVTASDETRTRRVSETSGTDEREAARQVKREDGNRADYLKRFYAVDRELPIHFDIVINTDAMTPEQAAGVIATAAK